MVQAWNPVKNTICNEHPVGPRGLRPSYLSSSHQNKSVRDLMKMVNTELQKKERKKGMFDALSQTIKIKLCKHVNNPQEWGLFLHQEPGQQIRGRQHGLRWSCQGENKIGTSAPNHHGIAAFSVMRWYSCNFLLFFALRCNSSARW